MTDESIFQTAPEIGDHAYQTLNQKPRKSHFFCYYYYYLFF